MWPFRRKPLRLVALDGGLVGSLKVKDYDLFFELCHLPAGLFWPQWKRIHPEDFPLGGMSPVSAASVIMPRKVT